MRVKFVGNRRFVLEELLNLTANVEINVIEGTHLQRDSFLKNKEYKIVNTKFQLLEDIKKGEFDLFVSNGLPYILDFDSLPVRTYVNVHPSFLPDLRGIDPVLGAILYKRDAGASCHLMDNGIDTGAVISRVRIPYTEDLGASLLYQLSFIAEKQCFLDAWHRNFKPLGLIQDLEGTIYFSRREDTRKIPFSSDEGSIVQVVRAFDNQNQGARFFVNSQEVTCYLAWVSTNDFLLKLHTHASLNEVIMVYEDTVVVKRDRCCLFLGKIKEVSQGWIGQIVTGR